MNPSCTVSSFEGRIKNKKQNWKFSPMSFYEGRNLIATSNSVMIYSFIQALNLFLNPERTERGEPRGTQTP